MGYEKSLKMEHSEIKNILCLRWGRIGDVMFTTPVFRAIRNKYPKSYIAVLVEPFSYDIISKNPDIDEIFTFDLKKNNHFENFREQFGFIRILRQKKFDLVIDLYNGGRSPFFAYLCGAKYRLGGANNWKRIFININYIPDNKIKHCIEGELDKIRPLGINDADNKTIMYISDDDRKNINGIFNIKADDLIIGINPGAACPSKRWKLEGFADVSDALIKKHKAKVIIIQNLGTEGEMSHKIAALMKHKPIVSPVLNLKELAALTEACTVFISGDSGPLHIAVAMGTSIVGLFTSTPPELAKPLSGEHRIIYKDIKCNPCLRKNCKDLKCVELIKPEEVLREVESLLKAKYNIKI